MTLKKDLVNIMGELHSEVKDNIVELEKLIDEQLAKIVAHNGNPFFEVKIKDRFTKTAKNAIAELYIVDGGWSLLTHKESGNNTIFRLYFNEDGLDMVSKFGNEERYNNLDSQEFWYDWLKKKIIKSSQVSRYENVPAPNKPYKIKFDGHGL